ncbi:MAG: serine/threonine protein kinase, partial [Planctomycetales bacterium]
MSAQQITDFLQQLPPEKRTAEHLARELVASKKITRFQGALIYRGKMKELFLGEYLLVDKLGEGGMGVVFQVRHRRLGRETALKVLNSRATNNEKSLKRFFREVQAVRQLDHPNIVKAIHADKVGRTYCLEMEFVDGMDLSQFVKQHGPLPMNQAVDCVLQTAQGLEHAHARGIIHRDVKPGNLLLDRKGRVKILDMGLARIEGGSDDAQDLTQTGQVIGTVTYMSPEQAINTKGADRRSDVYSLGCTLYFLLAGRPPYLGESSMETLVAHREEPIPALRAVNAGIPESLEEIFQLMLAKQPDHRYANMTELIEDLRHYDVSPTEGTLLAVEADEDPQLSGFLQSVANSHDGPQPAVAARATQLSRSDDTLAAQSESTRPEGFRPLHQASNQMVLVVGGIAAATLVLFLLAALFAAVYFSKDAPTGTIVVHVNEPGAAVFLDEKRVANVE